MRPVQPILIILLIVILFLYFGRLRSGMMDRVVVAAFVLLGMVMAAMPDLTTRIAAAVGVGRGVDLFFYMAFIGFGFFGLLLYSRLRDLQNTDDGTRARRGHPASARARRVTRPGSAPRLD